MSRLRSAFERVPKFAVVAAVMAIVAVGFVYGRLRRGSDPTNAVGEDDC